MRSVMIQEEVNGWAVVSGDETLATTKTAVDALAFVKKRDADLAMAAGRNVLTVVHWHTTSSIGARIVRAVAGAQ